MSEFSRQHDSAQGATGQLVDRVATAEEHAALSESVDWQSHFDDHLRSASLAASIAGVVYLSDEGVAVGMARAVGDGLQYAYIQDVIVHPDHDSEGIATMLVERLVELLRPDPGAEIFIGLFASEEAQGVYESLGFTSRGALGMHRRVSIQQIDRSKTMDQIWDQNEEKDEDEELVITEHRDADEPAVTPDEEQQIEVTDYDPRTAYEELGEDVSSSPAQRGRENRENSA